MNVVICAAGRGSRLKMLQGKVPKPLLKVNGKMLIERVMEAVAIEMVKTIVIVVGYQAELIKKAIGYEYKGKKIVYAFNENYDTSGNMSSLWAARDHFNDDTIFTVSDIIINKENVKKILESDVNAGMLVDISAEAIRRDDVLKISIDGNKITKVRKKMNQEEINAAACGFYKLKKGAAKKFIKIIEDHFDKGETDLPFNIPVEELCGIEDVVPVASDGSFCMDIDTDEDFEFVDSLLKKMESQKT